MDKASVVIIDDDHTMRRTLMDILKAKDYETAAAKDGAEGLALLRQWQPQVVLVDLGLPDMSGLEVLKIVRTEYPSTDAIILTGNATLDSAIEATNQGAFSYLLKPYDIDQLLVNIRRALEKQKAEEQVIRHGAALEKSNAELKALYEISKVAGKTLDLDKLLSEVLGTFVGIRIFPFDSKGAMFLVEGEGLRLASSIGLSEAVVNNCRSISFGKCLCGLAAAKGEILVSKDSEKDARHANCIPEASRHGHIAIP